MAKVTRIRNAIGSAMRRVGLHHLSGWWDAGTDLRELRKRWLAMMPDDQEAEVQRIDAELEKAIAKGKPENYCRRCGRRVDQHVIFHNGPPVPENRPEGEFDVPWHGLFCPLPDTYGSTATPADSRSQRQ